MEMSGYWDHNTEADCAVLRRSAYVGRQANRETPLRNAIVVQAALDEARRVMVTSEHLDAIEDVLAESISEEIDSYVATFIPVGDDDDLRDAFENIAAELYASHGRADSRFFEKLDHQVNAFKATFPALFGSTDDPI